jgi:hypothetical protein
MFRITKAWLASLYNEKSKILENFFKEKTRFLLEFVTLSVNDELELINPEHEVHGK